jgi:putative N6-adenine-specific DNA methylase
MHKLFAVTVPGLEIYTRQELAALGIAAQAAHGAPAADEPREDAGGVEFETNLSGLYRANLNLRTSNRIVARLGSFYAAAFSELRTKAARLPWGQYLRPGQPVALRVTCHKSKLYHSDAVAERVAGAIGDCLGQETPVQKFDLPESGGPLPQLVLVRLVHDHCTISVDTSGALLHRRGYRLETAKAPLRETLAAALLMAAGWTPGAPLVDPFCGSGTIPIEAALMARHIAPGKNRRFAFMDWPNFNPGVWKAALLEAAAGEQPSAGVILGSDRDTGAVRIAQANAARAGVEGDIQFSQRAFSAIEPPAGPGWIVTNPPYGVRVSASHDLRNLYTHLGDVLRTLCPGWKLGLLCADRTLAGHTHILFENNLALVNGGISVVFFSGTVEPA